MLAFQAVANERSKAVYFTEKEGLPRNIVSCFVQDKYGYGWIGTGNGITRFDGYKFHNYNSFRGHFINTIISDNNTIWVGTDAGLFRYDRLNDSFSQLQQGYIRKLSVYNSEIYTLKTNRLLKMNVAGEITSYDIDGVNSFEVTPEGIWYGRNDGLRLAETDVHLLKGRAITLIHKIDNVLWIACRNGDLYYLDNYNPRKIQMENHYNITDIEKIDDDIWVATDGGGILILDENHRLSSSLTKNQDIETLIPSNSIYDISCGLNDAVWVSSYGAGLILLLRENAAYRNIVPIPGNSNSLVDKEGVSVLVDENRFYFGTNYGFSIWNAENNQFTNLNAETLESQLNGRKVTAINKDETGNLWIGTYDGLIGKYNKNLRLIDTYHPCSKDKSEMQQVIFMFNSKNDELLIGTHYRDKSLLRFNSKTREATPVMLSFREQNKNNYQVNNIRKNKFGETIILIRNMGIFLYDEQNNVLDNFLPEINNRITFRLNDFYHDKTGNYWFATQTDGLVKLSPDGRIFEKWTINEGFPTNTLLSIESINDKIFWISTIDGLCRFNTENGQIQIFNYRHGLASNEFLPRTNSLTTDNKIVFGNSEGFLLLEPDKLIQDTSRSDVVISDISFHNRSIKNLENENYLKVPLEETVEIKLPFRRNSFTISFFTRDNDLPKFSNYAYMLEGLEENWIYLGENNQTTYTNLSPGKYLFKVKCTNKDNVWNEQPTELRLVVLPPWYTSWFAILAYIFVLSGLIYAFFYFYNKRLQWKKELEISEYKVKTEHELTEKKLAFFTNISHDLKTPLTLISAPVNDLLEAKNLKAEQHKKLEVIDRNSKRLYKLINDLIEFRKITQNQLPLKTRELDLRETFENIYEAFQIECDKKDIDFRFEYRVDKLVWVDQRKIEKIIWNLLSNSVKFTGNGGKIWLTVAVEILDKGGHLNLKIGDTGKGFTSEEKQHIFDRFYQIRKADNLKFDSSGIGLSIVSDLVKIHHGSIDVESVQGKGTEFTILIPCEESFFTQQEKWDNQVVQGEQENLEDHASDATYTEKSQPHVESKRYNLPRLLIVEDNTELSDYLSEHFKTGYKVIVAQDGQSGFDAAIENEPDIIITDVKMPGMNGHEMCRKLRENFGTSHIPLVMMTANSAIEQKVEGLKSGVDMYVTKPFEIKYLDAVLVTLLKNRKLIREKLLGIGKIDGELEKISEADMRFANDLKEFILNNVANENLNMDLLSQHFSISRTQLNRKIKALTGLTPNNYIKTIRLKKAYELIRKQGVRVAEAAYLTGFTDPNYFTICFKKEFGENPSKISEANTV